MKLYEKIYEKLKNNNVGFLANNNISEHLNEKEKQQLLIEIENIIKELLKALLIDYENDHNSKDTPKRLAKMYFNELFCGRYEPKPKITSFPNVANYDELYITGPISVKSMCSHHWMPIYGYCCIGVFPGKNVMGLSKFNRIVDWIARRPQIQEEMTIQIADQVENITNAKGVAVIISSTHMCVTHRGCKEHNNNMITSVMRGKFRTDNNLKNEFLMLIKQYDM